MPRTSLLLTVPPKPITHTSLALFDEEITILEYKDYYASLGVDRKAPSSEIQKAYRRLARKFHPDVNKTPEAESRFKEISEAYEVLKNDEKRAKYNQFGSAWKQAQQGGGQGAGFEDIFSSFRGGSAGGGQGGRVDFGGDGGEGFSSFFDALFGAAQAGGGRASGGGWQSAGGPRRPPAAGADQESRLPLSLEEAASGGTREITIADAATGRRKTLRVKIPAGIRAGKRIRLSGQGGQSPTGGKRGDLYLKIELLPSARFRLDGETLRTTLDVAPWEAALGGEAEVETLGGRVRVRVPAGSSTGRKIRLRGKGFPIAGGDADAAGDLIAELRIVVPSELTDEERDLYNQLSAVSSFRPRANDTP